MIYNLFSGRKLLPRVELKDKVVGKRGKARKCKLEPFVPSRASMRTLRLALWHEVVKESLTLYSLSHKLVTNWMLQLRL